MNTMSDRQEIPVIPAHETRTRHVTAFLSVYEITRHYGGPEEGGWYYDAYEHTGAAFPFNATQAEVWINEGAKEDAYDYNDGAWEPAYDEGPQVADEPTRVRLESARMHFVSIYGEERTNKRYSARPKGPDYVFITELEVGSRETHGKPRYE